MDFGPLIIVTPTHLIIGFFVSRWLMPVFHMVLFLALAASTWNCSCFAYILTKCCMDYCLVRACLSPEEKWQYYINLFSYCFWYYWGLAFQSKEEYTSVNWLLHKVTIIEQLIGQSNSVYLIAAYFMSLFFPIYLVFYSQYLWSFKLFTVSVVVT